MSATDEMLDANKSYVADFKDGALAMPPSRHVAIVACMDARLMVSDCLGIGNGEAHIIRNAGGIVNDETLRSLIISTKLLATTEIMVINHTDCGMLTFNDEELRAKLASETGEPVDTIPFYAFDNLEDNVRWQVKKIKASPFLDDTIPVRGFIYDVKTGSLKEAS